MAKSSTSYKEGESGNPKGKPVGAKSFKTLWREAIVSIAKKNGKDPDELELEMFEQGFARARKGDYRFYKDALDRIHGQAERKTDITTKGESLNILGDKKLDELLAIAKEKNKDKYERSSDQELF